MKNSGFQHQCRSSNAGLPIVHVLRSHRQAKRELAFLARMLPLKWKWQAPDS